MLRYKSFKKSGLAWLILVLGLLSTVLASIQVKQSIEQQAIRQFAFVCDQITLKIQERLNAYALILRGGSGLFSASDNVTRQDWHAYVETLRAEKSVHGIQGIGFSVLIQPAQLDQHMAWVRQQGFPDYAVKPAGERAIYSAIIYLEPFTERNLRAFGYDMYSEPVRRAAMEQARDTGQPALSGKVQLVQETQQDSQAGNLMYVPVYRKQMPIETVEQRRAALIGWSYSPYRMTDLMVGILGDWEAQAGMPVDMEIYDGLEAKPHALLFDNHVLNRHGFQRSLLQQRLIEFNGHQWSLRFYRSLLLNDSRLLPAWATLAGGFLLSGLLFGLLRSMNNTRANALRIAHKLTEELNDREQALQESEFRWKFAIEGSGDGLWDWNVPEDKAFFSINWKNMLGYQAHEIGNGKEEWVSRIHPDDKPAAMAALMTVLSGEKQSFRHEHRLRCKDGSFKWILDRGMVVNRSEEGQPLRIIGIHSDISLRKQVEDDLRFSEERFRVITSSAQDALVMQDAQGNISFWNPAAERLFGYSADEALGRNLHALLTPKRFIPAHQLAFPHFQKTGEGAAIGKTLEFFGQHRDGHEFPIELSLSAVQVQNAWHAIGIVRDISDRKRLEQEKDAALDLLQKIANRVPGMVYQYRLNPDGSHGIPYASGAIQDLFGISPDDVRNDASGLFKRIHADDYPSLLASIQQSAQAMSRWSFEFRSNYSDGSVHWLQGNAQPEREADGSTLWHGFISDITERKRDEAIFQALFQQSSFLAGILDQQGRLIDINNTALQVIDAERDDVIGHYFPHTPWWNNPRDRVTLLAALNTAYQGKSESFEAVHSKPDGSHMDVIVSVMPIYHENGLNLAVIGLDITERKLAEEQLQLAASVFTHAGEGILITDAEGSIIDVNQAFCDITGYEPEDVMGQKPSLLSAGNENQDFYEQMWRYLIDNGEWYGEVWNRRKNGETFAEMLNISAVKDSEGRILNYVALFSDITLLKSHERELEHIAHYDALTGLPNRVLLADRLHQAMAHAQRNVQSLAVVFLDLDGFKAINDNHGHNMGDHLLLMLANRMKQTLREIDTLSRLGGDEFVAVLLNLADIEACAPMLQRLLEAASEPVKVDNALLQVSASLGVTFYPQTGDVDADQLLRQADQAMYQAKLAGKNRYHLFDAAMDNNVRHYHESLDRIRQALVNQEFVLYYQPKVNMRTGEIVGVEALIRWLHPQKSLMMPNAFLPVIEDHPLAVEIGEWVLDTALRQVNDWQSVGLKIPVSVNISARHLQDSRFVERLRELLAAYPAVNPGCLELEVLESSALENIVQVSQIMDACRDMGVLFALDDFGTGYCSLTYLKQLPVTMLKVDQSFVRDMLDDPDDLAILDGVLGLATAFGCKVIAEGVETFDHGEMLLQLGCELAQGYGIAKPMPGTQLVQWSVDWQTHLSWSGLTAMKRADLPLLFARAWHQAWYTKLELYVDGKLKLPPQLHSHQCQLGQWLDTSATQHYADHPQYQSIYQLHQAMHAQAIEICRLHGQGQNPAAQSKLLELSMMRDQLLEQLSLLVKTVHRRHMGLGLLH
jgi:diguanylate cyclase (GGDEF)-like protein/PAS domain S-box-containing protein